MPLPGVSKLLSKRDHEASMKPFDEDILNDDATFP